MGIAEFLPVFPKQLKADFGSALACVVQKLPYPKCRKVQASHYLKVSPRCLDTSQQNSVRLLGKQSTENLEGFMMQIKGRKKKEDTFILCIKSSHQWSFLRFQNPFSSHWS